MQVSLHFLLILASWALSFRARATILIPGVLWGQCSPAPGWAAACGTSVSTHTRIYIYTYKILSARALLISVIHSVPALWTAMASGPVVFSKWVFFYREISATNSFENLICFHMEKNPLTPRIKKHFCPHIFQWKKNKFGKFTLISPESRHCLYFPSNLPMLRKTTHWYSPLYTTIVLIFSSTVRCCPFARPAHIWVREAKHFCGTPANPIEGPTQALKAFWGARNTSPALETKCFRKTSCLLSFFNRGETFVTALLEEKWQLPGAMNPAPQCRGKWNHTHTVSGQLCSGNFLEGCRRDAQEVFKPEGISGR